MDVREEALAALVGAGQRRDLVQRGLQPFSAFALDDFLPEGFVGFGQLVRAFLDPSFEFLL